MTRPGDYERGIVDGGIAERLAGHDRHFDDINGQLLKVAAELSDVSLGLQRIADQAAARDASVILTAAALKDADLLRRARSAQAWSPVQRIYAGLGGLAALVAVVGAVVVIIRGG